MKTVPAQLMAAAVSEVPVIVDVVGSMITSAWRGERLGAAPTAVDSGRGYRAGELDDQEIGEVGTTLATTAGTCMVMGTASTMATMAETLGMMLPGGATPPAPSGDRLRHGTATGRRAVELAREQRLPRQHPHQEAFENALLVLGAIGGSTNAVVHMLAIARRAGVDIKLDDFDRLAREVPLLVDLKPSGEGYMEDFHESGGVPVLLKALESELHTAHVGVSGRSLAENLANVQPPRPYQHAIRPLSDPVGPPGAIAVVSGSLAPDGAVIKVSAASQSLLDSRRAGIGLRITGRSG